jgi:multidrug efflux pump subunit AcrB
MSRAIAWMVHNPVAANLFMCLLVAGGLMALPTINQEEFPSIETDMLRATVVYLGAAPEEVEEGVCVRIEEVIDGAQDIDRVASLAVEGACTVTIEAIVGSDVDALLDDVKNRIDGINTFPVETETPIVSKVVMRNGVVTLALTGEADERTLKVLGQQVRDEISALPGVSQVDLTHVRPYEISIEVSEAVLRRHGLSFDQVASAVRRWSLDMPGGSVKASGGEILLRAKGQAYSGREFDDVVVMTRTDGTTVTLGEIATVRDTFRDDDLYARFNGEPTVLIAVKRIGEEDILEIAASVLAYAEAKQPYLPAGMALVPFNDESLSLKARLDALTRNARSGLILVLLILGLFLRFRLAMWVAAGVPIAFLGAVMFFPVVGLSISTLSVMAFILVLGIVVDDAIVIGESVYTHERNAEGQVEAAIAGTRDVYVPVIFGVMTTVAAFLPLVFIPGRMGRFFSVIGVTAILCLVFSLLESQLILPAHLAHRRTDSKKGTPNPFVKGWQKLQGSLGTWLEDLGRVHYRRALQAAIAWRYVTLAIAIGVLVIAAALFASGRMRYQFFPSIEGDVVFASLTMPRGIPLAVTEDAVRRIEEAAFAVRDDLDMGNEGPSRVVHVLTTVGGFQGRDGPPDLSVNTGGSHLAEISIELVPYEERGEITSTEIAARWRAATGPIPDAVELTFSAEAFGMGPPVNVQLRGSDVAQLSAAARVLEQELAGYKGVYDISDSFREGKQEVQLAVRPEARSLGVALDDLAGQVRQAFYGEEVQRVQRGRDDVRVMLRYPEAERRSLGFLEQMRIRTQDGTEVPFGAVAEARLGRGYATIRRSDRMRVVNVIGEIDRTVATPEEIMGAIERDMPRILSGFPGVQHSLEGEQREHGKAAAGLVRGAALSLLLIYALLAIPLKSYTQPLAIMSVIPFGAVGAVFGHLIMGWDLLFFSVLGIVALSGVVVNASLVLVHAINKRRAAGVPFLEAVELAGSTRFRPIVLTSVTTYIGLVPLMFEGDIQAQMLIPMAISLGYGVLFASVMTLFLVPSLYVILDDVRRLRLRPAPGADPAAMPVAGGR